MTGEVIIEISGLHRALDGTEEPVKLLTTGTCYEKNGKTFILYDEYSEDNQVTKNIIKYGGDELEITKRGLVNTRMFYELGKLNVSGYMTPYGELTMGVDTKRIFEEKGEDFLLIYLEYALEMNEEHTADCSLKIKLKSKN